MFSVIEKAIKCKRFSGLKNKIFFSFKTLFIMFSCFLVIATGLFVVYLSHRNSRYAVNDFVTQLRNETNGRISDHLDHFFSVPLLINDLNSITLSKNPELANDKHRTTEMFWNQINTFQTVSSIYFGNIRGGLANAGRESDSDSLYVIHTENFDQGKFLKYRTDKSGQITRYISVIEDFDARTRPWFLNAVSSGRPYFSDAYLLFTGQDLTVTASKPVYDTDNSLIGVAAVDIFLSQLNQFLPNLEIGRTGESFILDKKGRVLASSSENFEILENAESSINPYLQQAAEILFSENYNHLPKNGSVDFDFTLDGELFYARSTRIDMFTNLQWTILTLIPESDFMQRVIDNNLRTFSYILVGLLLTLLCAIFISNKITAQLSKLSKAIGEFSLDEWTKLASNSRIIELKKLSTEFNGMGETLKDAFTNFNLELKKRRETEKDLTESKNQIKTISDNIPGGLVYQIILNKSGKSNFSYISKGSIELHGYKPQEIMKDGDILYNQILEEDRVDFYKKESESVKSLCKLDTEVRVRLKDGNISWRRVISQPRVNHYGEVIFDGLEIDITEKKKIEKLIKEEKERLAVTLASIGDGVITTDINGNIVDLNKTAEVLTGWTHKEAFGKPLTEVFSIVNRFSRKKAPDPVSRVTKTGKIIKLSDDIILLNKKGDEVKISDSGAPIKDASGSIIGVVIVFRDVTEKEKMIEKIHRGDKLESLGLLAGGIAHDFNNLLNAIFGYLELTRININEREYSSALSFISKTFYAFERAKSLTDQLITFSKGGEPVKKPGNLEKEVHDALNIVFAGSDIQYQVNLQKNLWSCYYDSGQINQVINNILINSKQAMDKGGKVSINAENTLLNKDELRHKRFVKVSISDNGPGIPLELQKKIFDPFFTTKPKGNGLGLAICHSIITKHEGFLEVSSNPGKGTELKIFLPAYGDKIDKEKRTDNVFHVGEGKIIIMDDENFIREITGEMLRTMGYEPVYSKDGEDLIQKLGEHEQSSEVKAIIVDLTIPGGMGGKEAIQLIRKKYPDIIAFASSGYSSDPIISYPQKFGFTSSIRKPYKLDDLHELFNKFLN